MLVSLLASLLTPTQSIRRSPLPHSISTCPESRVSDDALTASAVLDDEMQQSSLRPLAPLHVSSLSFAFAAAPPCDTHSTAAYSMWQGSRCQMGMRQARLQTQMDRQSVSHRCPLCLSSPDAFADRSTSREHHSMPDNRCECARLGAACEGRFSRRASLFTALPRTAASVREPSEECSLASKMSGHRFFRARGVISAPPAASNSRREKKQAISLMLALSHSAPR